MQKYLITTVSSLALLMGATSLAAAQETPPPGAPPGAEQPEGVQRSPDAAPLQRENKGDMPGAAAMDEQTYKSYEEDKAAAQGAEFPSGFTAEQLLGANVVNQEGDEIGEVQDLTIDSQNRVSKAIIEVGGFLGIGSKYVALDVEKLQAGAKDKGFVSTLSKEELEALPEYEKEGQQWVRQGAGGMGPGSEPGTEGGQPEMESAPPEGGSPEGGSEGGGSD